MTSNQEPKKGDISDSELESIYQQAWDDGPVSDEEIDALIDKMNSEL